MGVEERDAPALNHHIVVMERAGKIDAEGVAWHEPRSFNASERNPAVKELDNQATVK
jgi:hypothetical protein